MNLTPIAFFAYNRPEHAFKSLMSLSQCELADQSHLFIFSDGEKSPKEREQVLKVRETIESKQWCGKVSIIHRERNLGCDPNIISGVETLLAEYGRVIVIEDDLVLSPGFLQYMNRGLEMYWQEEKVMQISGYMFPVPLTAETDAIFLPFTTSWGWATWQRAWKHFDPLMSGYAQLKKNRDLKRAFNLNGSYDFFKILRHTVNGKIIPQPWDIRFYLTVFLLGGLVLHPVRSLIQNMGFDGSGVHHRVEDGFANLQLMSKIEKFPEVSINTECFNKIVAFFKGRKRSIKMRIIFKFSKILKRLKKF